MTNEWMRGLPPGKYYEGMVDDYEVTFTVGGMKWHRRRSDSEKAEYLSRRAANAAKITGAGVER